MSILKHKVIDDYRRERLTVDAGDITENPEDTDAAGLSPEAKERMKKYLRKL
ncbi:hypothetical protein [Desulfatitalea alkaliphila]|uniref:Uncharacterized protein n=1 Tax=Desulfatitalea alkaliphila TaxID=2929485 RepID=A0AA41R228_9BACT|nr:hypothetical protein [Desulfatitalea alkaliphila]MCJ8501512.1 hypothetical protein [Desulfatitalea alkaliphila]